MEKNEIINKLKYVLIFALGSITLELIAFWSLKFGFLPEYFLFDLTFILILSAIIFLLKTRTAKIITIIVSFSIQLILNIVNACYYTVLGDIFSFDLLKLGNETAKAFELSFINFEAIIVNLLAFIGFILILLQITKFDKPLKKLSVKKFSSFTLILAFFIMFSSFGLTTNIIAQSTLATFDTTDELYLAKSDEYLYNHFQFKQEAFKKFGTFGFYLKSIDDLIFKNDKLTNEEKLSLQNYIQNGIVNANNDAPLKDDNLIVIMLESFEWFAIDPYCTPTLYNLKENEAQTFSSFYARNKTNVSESIGMLGNTVKNYDFQSLSKNKKFSPENSLAYMFRDIGYTSNYFHSFDGNFYDRYNVNKKFGFENVYTLQDANLGKLCDFGDFYLEEDYLNAMINKLAPTDKQFFSFYTTVGTHGPHDNFNKRYNEYLEFYENNLVYIKTYLEDNGYHLPTDKTFYNRLKEYKCAAMDTDKMLESLLNHLETNNILDKTTIVLYSDHNCYYNDLNLLTRYNSKNFNANSPEIHNIPFMIYSEKLAPEKIDSFCSTYDIYPTICSLFGLEYNKNLTQGYDIYSNDIENTVFVSNLSGIFNKEIYSYNILDYFDNSLLGLTNEEVLDFQLNAINFFEKQLLIDKIYANGLVNRY